MRKIKLGSTVCYTNKPDIELEVVEIVKGAKTNKPVYHGGILFTGYQRKPKKFKLSDGTITLPDYLKLIKE